jgi:hypothetical protein
VRFTTAPVFPMSKFTILAWLASAVLVASALLNFRQSHERGRLAGEVARLQQAAMKTNEVLQRERAALREVRQQLEVIRERDLTQPPSSSSPEAAPVTIATRADATLSPATAAMLNYLGDPVLPPTNMDPKYSADAVMAAFKGLCESRGIKIQQLGIDQAEFPFVLHGVVSDGREFFRQISAELGTLPGYSYAGSVTGHMRGGSTYFSLNMTPHRSYPRELAETIDRRLMLRLQMLAAAWSDLRP